MIKDKNLQSWRLSFSRVHDVLNPYAHLGVLLYLAWAGSLPYGNAKAVTVYGILRWFRKMKAAGFYKDVDIIVENTSGNTGVVMIYMILPDPTLGIKEVRLIVKNDLPEPKKMGLIIGGANVMPAMKPLSGIATARQMGGGGWLDGGLKANGNVLNFDQYGHAAGPEIHAEFTGPAILEGMLEQFGCAPNQLFAGIGSGGTILGIDDFLQDRLDGRVGTSGVLLGPEQEGPGMRSRADMGEITLPVLKRLSERGRIVEAWTRPSYLAAMWLARVTGYPVGASTGSTYMGWHESIRQQIADGSINGHRGADGKVHCVMFGADSNGAYTDRFMAHLPFEKWDREGKLPLPWEWNWRGDLPAKISAS